VAAQYWGLSSEQKLEKSYPLYHQKKYSFWPSGAKKNMAGHWGHYFNSKKIAIYIEERYFGQMSANRDILSLLRIHWGREKRRPFLQRR